jgi:SAM-dependent methyltransferase
VKGGKGGKVSWQDYNDAQMTRQPRPLTTRIIELAGPGDGRRAIDLGCGSGVETRALVAAGWHVTAVDADPSMPPRLADLVAGGLVETVVADLRGAALPATDLVHGSLSLPFVPRDDWSSAPELTFQRRGEALARHPRHRPPSCLTPESVVVSTCADS